MKLIPASFDKNSDHFEQVIRENNIAIFKRTKIGNKVPNSGSFEVVRINRRNACEIMGNAVEAKEVYPGAKRWGIYGLSAPDLQTAQSQYKRFQEKFKGQDNLIGPSDDDEEENKTTKPEGKKRGRGRTPLDVKLELPEKGEWTIKQMATKHKVSPAWIYLRVMDLLEEGKVKEVGKKKLTPGRGKPSVVYATVKK
jgi:hypothetical protein